MIAQLRGNVRVSEEGLVGVRRRVGQIRFGKTFRKHAGRPSRALVAVLLKVRRSRSQVDRCATPLRSE